jgi:hypothetical protein
MGTGCRVGPCVVEVLVACPPQGRGRDSTAQLSNLAFGSLEPPALFLGKRDPTQSIPPQRTVHPPQ